MEFSRQEYWSGLPFPSPADLPDPELKPRSCALQADSLPSEPPGKPWFSLRAPQLFLFFPCCSETLISEGGFPELASDQSVD